MTSLTERTGYHAHALVKSTKGRTHALDPERYARTLCGLQDEFEWCWPSLSLDALDCGNCWRMRHRLLGVEMR